MTWREAAFRRRLPATRPRCWRPSRASGSLRSAGRSRISAISARSSWRAGNGWTTIPTPTSSRSASSCPDPPRSQVGISIGLFRAGYLGAFAAWLGFTLPSAIALVLFAYGVERLGGSVRRRLDSRTESGGGGGGGAGRARDDAHARAGPRTRDPCGRSRGDRAARADRVGTDRRDRIGRAHRGVAIARATRRSIRCRCR